MNLVSLNGAQIASLCYENNNVPDLMTMGPSAHTMGRVYGCGDSATRSANEVNMSSRACAIQFNNKI